METKELTAAEWKLLPVGTKGVMVKTYNGNNGKLVGLDYLIKGDDEHDFLSKLRDLKEVASGYFTETYNVTRK